MVLDNFVYNSIRFQTKPHFLIFVFFLAVHEILWSYRFGKKTYNLWDTTNNFITYFCVLIFSWPLHMPIYNGLNAIFKFRLFDFPNSLLVFVLSLIAVDFMYYWYHRLEHSVKFLWAFHMVHHSSQLLNISTAFRINFLINSVFVLWLVPLVLLGFPPTFILSGWSFTFLYSVWCHTPSIGKIKWLEGILNTPSAHRVHHACNKNFINKNFASIFTIWDRVFKTYAAEDEIPIIGMKKGFITNNPVSLISYGIINYWRGNLDPKEFLDSKSS